MINIKENKQLRSSVLIFKVSAGLGLLLSLFMILFLATMATDSPSSTGVHALLGGLVAAVIFIPVFVILPWYAAKRLEVGEQTWQAYVYSGIAIFVVFPLSTIAYIYVLYALAKTFRQCNQSENQAGGE